MPSKPDWKAFNRSVAAFQALGDSIVEADAALRRAICSALGVPARYFRSGYKPAEHLPERWFGEHIESYVYRCPESLDNPTIRWEYQVYILSTPLRLWRRWWSGKWSKLRRYERGQGLVEYALIIILVAVCVVVFLAVLSGGGIPQTIDPQARYENVYNKCIARETISAEHCHDLAVEAAYPGD